MKTLAVVAAAGSLFALAPLATGFGPVASSATLVWLSVLLATCVSGELGARSVACGALGALGSGVVAEVSPATAGAILLAAAFADRTTRIRARTAGVLHIGLALGAGALAGSVSSSFANASPTAHVVSLLVAAVLASLPLMVEADDRIAHALDEASVLVSEPARTSLMKGAELRRSVCHLTLDTGARGRVEKTWQSLLRLAEARIRLERSSGRSPATPDAEVSPDAMAPPSAAHAVLTMVDQRICEHIEVLSKAFTAQDTARAAALGLDASDLEAVDSMGDSLDDASRAMLEVKAGKT